MSLLPSTHLTAASWITGAAQDWSETAVFGPPSLPAHARLRFMPDPEHPGATDNSTQALSEHRQLGLLLDVLSRHTRTPRLGYFCLWEGWGVTPEGSGPADVEIPNRAYYLFEGPLSAYGQWVAGHDENPPPPAFVWPADHAWCVARDIDPHWAGIGASEAAVEELMAVPGLDIVRADPTQAQPHYF
ncbi:hypothetical protein [Kineosporia mesophila]|uniref:hypothetical protein n=1 Tax=Kineosporia mesophila TaxID=566012 RepID=UPI001E5011CB|nr:hypothetical protein [Kineosporia mesophila]MCD5355015.1 hypothetical protein [Kineosporia mesophila]